MEWVAVRGLQLRRNVERVDHLVHEKETENDQGLVGWGGVCQPTAFVYTKNPPRLCQRPADLAGAVVLLRHDPLFLEARQPLLVELNQGLV